MSDHKSLFYTGTYTGADEQGIFLCSLDLQSGQMEIVNGTDGIANSSFLALNDARDRLYAVSETEQGEVYAYSVDAETGELHLLDRKPTEGSAPCYIALTRDESHVLVANYSSGHVDAYRIGDQGELELSSLVQHSGSSINQDRQEGAHPHSVFQDPEGKYVLVCDLGMDEIVFYRLEDGKLVSHHAVKTAPGAGPRHFDFHPSGQWAYGINELDDTVNVYALDSQAGDMKILQTLSALPEGAARGSASADIHITPCGRFLYASNRSEDSIGLYHVNPSTGLLTSVEWVSTGGKTPRNFAVFKGGYVLAANQNSSTIVSFKIDKENGRLTPTGYALEVPKPVCILPVTKCKH
ncbi:beta-propeller fold lactonase family protein [Paenibacillus sp. HJL G12]|uniref:Beta-propeller fold lactonase family protein n=1 Tax=Paenibacillus dendrobii TaxID=2691084 RepID=A0A7X3LHH0_9BACL|nr:lactonase family protein [Paenibacillus dendrobii]MWV45816.1 beta-propeller fold lactonase family protein [Paenibacillus dendrobii]